MLVHRLKESAPDANSTELTLPTPEPEHKPSHKRSFLQWFYNLSISRKTQIVPWFTFVALVGIVGAGAVLIVTGGRTQLLKQAKAELAVTKINYDIKINQLGIAFGNQSQSAVIIAAAKASVPGQTLTPAVRNQVKQILQNDAKSLKIEYATLVGNDLRIIANANRDRTGEIFNPNNLVSQVFGYPQQIKTSAIVSGAELAQESPLLPPGFANQDALIRYTVTPVIDSATQTVIGAIVSGDIVNGKLSIVEETLNTFGSGYSAIYLRKSTKEFTLATALDKGKSQLKLNVELPNTSLLEAADKARGVLVTGRMDVGGQTYTTAAKAVLNSTGDPVAILVRGTPETELNALIKNSLSIQLFLSALGLGVIWFLATILSQAIAKPVQQLQRTTQEFSEGDRGARAEVFADDEVGQLAVTFNQMADSIETNQEAIRRQEELRFQEQELATHQQAENAAQQRTAKEQLQKRALELLMEVEPISKGDLTIRASVTEDEIGTIADSYNATIASLRKIVTQVQTAAIHVTTTTSSNQVSVQDLSTEALRQAQEIAATLDRIQEMSNSSRAVAANAQQAEAAVQQATQTVEVGDAAMNRTVDGILALKETVAETSIKVQRLGESSQKISKVVKLISSFADQTNLLALNAAIEAARAGKEGRGFAVIADEVQSLANQSADATAEIESLVTEIQTETKSVVAAMEAGTQQVVEGTKLVDETRQSLNKITAVSAQISALVSAIASSAVAQSQVSESVTQTMSDVAAISSKTSTEATQVSASFKELLAVAQDLQASAGQFKVS